MLPIIDVQYLGQNDNVYFVRLPYRVICRDGSRVEGTVDKAMPKSQTHWDGSTFYATQWIVQKKEEDIGATLGGCAEIPVGEYVKGIQPDAGSRLWVRS